MDTLAAGVPACPDKSGNKTAVSGNTASRVSRKCLTDGDYSSSWWTWSSNSLMKVRLRMWSCVDVHVAVQVVALVLDDAGEEVLRLEGVRLPSRSRASSFRRLRRGTTRAGRGSRGSLQPFRARPRAGDHRVHEDQEGHLARARSSIRHLDDARRRPRGPAGGEATPSYSYIVSRMSSTSFWKSRSLKASLRTGSRRAQDRVGDAGDLQDGHGLPTCRTRSDRRHDLDDVDRLLAQHLHPTTSARPLAPKGAVEVAELPDRAPSTLRRRSPLCRRPVGGRGNDAREGDAIVVGLR